MILDRLSHAAVYHTLGRHFAAGFDYLRGELTTAPDGRYEIAGEDVFAMVQSYPTKSQEQSRWEAHRRYADIQYMITGRERMGIAPIEQLKTQTSYNAETDLEFFTGDGQFVTVEEGSFAIFLPHDVHMPNLLVNTSARVKKVVVKVKVG